MFWQFSSEEILPENVIIEQKTTDNGDVCHHNINGLKPDKAKKIFKEKFSWDSAFVCDKGEHRPLTKDDLADT